MPDKMPDKKIKDKNAASMLESWMRQFWFFYIKFMKQFEIGPWYDILMGVM